MNKALPKNVSMSNATTIDTINANAKRLDGGRRSIRLVFFPQIGNLQYKFKQHMKMGGRAEGTTRTRALREK